MRRNAPAVRGPWAAIAAVLSFGWPAAAQEPTDGFFGEEVDVRVVNLEVVVEDRAGNRVHGLKAEEFRLLVDGQEVDIEYFTEVAGRRARTSGSAGTPPAIGEGEAVATNYVLFVDDDHTHPTLRRPVLHGFRDRLARLPAADQLAVVVQSGRQLEIVSPFTADREATRAAIAEFDRGGRFSGFLRAGQRHRLAGSGGTSGSGNAVPSRKVPLAGTIRGAIDSEPLVPTGSFLGVGSLESPARWPGSGSGRMGAVYAEGIGSFGLDGQRDPEVGFRDLRFSVDAVVSTMRALEPPPGRKVFLLLAGSWPSGDFGLASSEKSTDLHLLDALIDTANLLGYTVYPMDQQRRPRGWLWQNLRYVASGTGGRAFMAGTNVRALDIVNDDTSNYYWLGFVPRYQRDDEAHDVRIEVEEPRLRVRSRRGYLDLSRRAEADMEALRELLFPAEAERAGGALLVEIGDADRLKRRMMSVPVGVYLPVGRFPAIPHDGRFVQDLEVRVAAVDRWGRRTGVPVQRLRLGGPTLPEAEDVVLYRTSLALRRLAHDLVVTVHDPRSRSTASARTRVAP